MRKISLLIIVLVMGFQLKAQQYIYVKKAGKTPVERIGIFDSVKIKVIGNEEWIVGKIQMIAAESLTINNKTFLLKDIRAIRTYHEMLRLGGTAMYAGGVFFTAIAFLNRTINGDRPLLYPSQIILGSVLVSSGLIMRWIGRNTYYISKGYTFELIDFKKVE